ncbi:MAG: IS701 family transposase [Deltaproteobacteria bacterium]|nr:IS701 family transposase [Deltaproteobacteria bacterium]
MLPFKRSEGRESLERHVTGLLADIDCKNGEQIAQAVAGTNSQRLQALLTELQWEAPAVTAQRVKPLRREATAGEGVLIFDDTGMPKQGSASVGVERQYSGTLGKVANGQVVVSCQYAEARFSWPVNARLYLPESWTQEAARCARAQVPEERRPFAPKPEIALTLLDEADRWGVPYRTITADTAYGGNLPFLAGLEQRHKLYVVAVPCDCGGQLARRANTPVERADTVLRRLPKRAWQTIRWGQGSQGVLRKKVVRVRCWRATAGGRGTSGWLIGERPGRGQEGEWKYYFSNAGPQATLKFLVRSAHQRHHIEQFYQEAKGALGWDQYEGRLWHGFHRHAVLVFLADSFLVLLRTQQHRRGRGRPPRLFSPVPLVADDSGHSPPSTGVVGHRGHRVAPH